VDRAVEELEFGRNHGAVGVHLNGVETGYCLSDPYLYPLYEKAQDLDLAIVVCLGEFTRLVPNLPIGKIVPHPEARTSS
jgi:predicted TIM-barrel fold metal-dependent hydrolase